MKARQVLAGLLLAVFGVVCAGALLEAGVRVLHLLPDRFWEPDPLLGVRLIADKRGWWTQEDREFVVPVQINRHGFRDIERSHAKQHGTFRILVLGDSFVEAMHVPLDATFPRLLEAQLNPPGATTPIEVLSLGVSGYGTAGAVLLFEKEGQRYHPDVVVLAFYPGNDVKNNSPELEDTLRPVYGPNGMLERVVSAKERQPGAAGRGLLARSAAYRYFRQLLLQQHPQVAQRLADWGLMQRAAVQAVVPPAGIPVDYGVYAPEPPAEWQTAWRHTDGLLARLRRSVGSHHARLAILVLPSRDQVYPQWWQEILSTYPAMQGKVWDLDGPQRWMEAWCGNNGVPCLSLTPGFREVAARGGEPLHYHRDGHFTAAGHRVAAEALKQFLEERRLLPDRHVKE